MRAPHSKLPRPKEDVVHRAVFDWLQLVLLRPAVVFHVPNEGKRSAATAKLQQRLGLLAGVFDLTILLPGGRVAFLEVKRQGERLSAEQENFGALLDTLGIPWALVRSVDDARDAVAMMAIPTREAA